MLIIITYQIKSDRLRTRVNKTLKNFGGQVQNSVFEFRLDNTQLKTLYAKLDDLKDQLTGKDSIRVYQACEKCARSMKTYGNAVKNEEPLYYIV